MLSCLTLFYSPHRIRYPPAPLLQRWLRSGPSSGPGGLLPWIFHFLISHVCSNFSTCILQLRIMLLLGTPCSRHPAVAVAASPAASAAASPCTDAYTLSASASDDHRRSPPPLPPAPTFISSPLFLPLAMAMARVCNGTLMEQFFRASFAGGDFWWVPIGRSQPFAWLLCSYLTFAVRHTCIPATSEPDNWKLLGASGNSHNATAKPILSPGGGFSCHIPAPAVTALLMAIILYSLSITEFMNWHARPVKSFSILYTGAPRARNRRKTFYSRDFSAGDFLR